MSYGAIYYHLVYAVKGRRAAFNSDEMARLCDFTGGIVRSLNCMLHVAGGPADHIHLAVSLDPGLSLAEFVRTVKAGTSKWVHQSFPKLEWFAWQEGYAAFTVSHSGMDKVMGYIRNQQEHHRKLSFEEELRLMFQKHEAKFDERFLTGG